MAGSDLIRVVSKRSGSYAAAFAPDGESLVCLKRNVTKWETERKKRIASAHPLKHPSHVAFAPDGSVIVVKGTAGQCVALDPGTLDTVLDLGGAEYGEGNDPLLTERGEMIDTSWDGDRLVRKMKTGAVVFHEHTGRPTSFASSVDGTTVVFAQRLPAQPDEPIASALSIWHAPFLQSEPRLLCPRIDSDAKPLAVCAEYLASMNLLHLEIRSTTTGEVLTRQQQDFEGVALQLGWWPGTDLLVAVTFDGFRLYDHELNERGRIPNDYPSHIAFARDGSRAFLSGWEESLLVALA